MVVVVLDVELPNVISAPSSVVMNDTYAIPSPSSPVGDYYLVARMLAADLLLPLRTPKTRVMSKRW